MVDILTHGRCLSRLPLFWRITDFQLRTLKQFDVYFSNTRHIIVGKVNVQKNFEAFINL